MKSGINNLLLLLLILKSQLLFAQQGDYLITTHKPDINNIDNINFQIIQDEQGLMYFANRAGILVYDGVEWDFYGTPGAALSMNFGPQGELFVGCLNNFGMIGYKDNAIKYISLSGQFGKTIGMIFQILNYNHKVIFVGEETLYIYNENEKTVESHNIENGDMYYNLIFKIDSTLYSNTSDGAINKLNKDFKPDSTFYLPDSTNLAFIRQNHETGMIISGSYGGNIYSLVRNQITSLSFSEYFISHNIQLIDGYWYDKSKFVVGTLEKGCLILDLDKNRMDTVDFDNGLPDNEVSTLYVDKSHGIWVGHEFGLSRITPEIPIRSFSHYPGLEGNLFAIQRFNRRIYISTSVGVYYLDAVKNFKSTVYYVRRPDAKPTGKKDNVKPKTANTVVEKKDEKRGFLGLFRIRKKQDKEENVQAFRTNDQESRENEKSRPGFFRRLFSKKQNETDRIKGMAGSKDYQRKVRKDLQSIEYVFKPVDGVKAKCKQLITYRDKLLAVSNSGVFDITGNEGSIIINEPVRYLYHDTINDQLIMSGYDRSIKTFKLIGDLWIELQDIPLNEIITVLSIDQNRNLWLAGPSHLYKAQLSDTLFTIDHVFPIENQLIDIPLMAPIKDKFYFIYSLGYFYYDGDTIREDPAYKEALGLPVKYLQSPDGLIWVFNGRTWNRINSEGTVESFEYLSLFPDMRFISYDQNRDIYRILTASNKTFVYEHSLSKKMQPGSDLILKRITTNNGLISDHNKIILTWEDNTLSFKFSEPDYLGLLNVEYQYKLVNHMKVWSEWSPVNTINLNYLQAGKYSLVVRARDTFGRIKESNQIAFRVKPPYWKQPWFYGLEILILGTLILAVKRLRRVGIRYTFIVDGLGILTLILILALIQSTIQNYFNIKSTPMTDFVVNVIVAIIAFPLEERLRKLLI